VVVVCVSEARVCRWCFVCLGILRPHYPLRCGGGFSVALRIFAASFVLYCFSASGFASCIYLTRIIFDISKKKNIEQCSQRKAGKSKVE